MAPNVRCRWVARELRTGETIFVATAPYETIRMMIYLAVSQEESHDNASSASFDDGTRRVRRRLQHPTSANEDNRTQISLIDIRRAYFNATVNPEEPIYVEFPPEDPMHGQRCGRLNRHLYGTRRAAAGWEDKYAETMENMGFVRGIASGCIFFHPAEI